MSDRVIDELRSLLARNLPGYEVRSVADLGEGLDNVAREVNGELIVRVSKEADPTRRVAAVRREAALLAALGGLSTVPVPEVVFADPGAGAITYRRLPGLPLMDHPVAEPARLAPVLGEFLGRLHRASPEKMERLVGRDDYPPAAWLEDARRDYRRVADRLPATARRRIEGFLGAAPPADPETVAFCHNDLGSEHILVDRGTNAVTGIIDWTDAAVADPARDLAPVYRDLGPEVLEQTLAHYGGAFGDADRERAIFYARCKLIEDVAYGLSHPGARRYADAGLSHLVRTFA